MSQLVREGNHLKPKYLKLADLIISQIEEGTYQINDRIPSVNRLSREFKISRETVLKSLTFLSERGIIEAAYRQGYFVKKTNVKVGHHIFFLMDKMTQFKNKMYHSFLDTIGESGRVHLFFYHHNFDLFRSFIVENLNNYTHFVVVTYLKEDASSVLNLIPPEKRLILDHFEPNLEGEYAMVHQDFENDMYNILLQASNRLGKYKKLVLVCAQTRYEGEKVTKGFKRFCKEQKFDMEVVENVAEKNFKQGNVYVILSPDDHDLVEVIKLKNKHGFEIGKDIGLLSYNDTYVNEVLEGGISVFSTDFELLGRNAAQMILNKEIKIIVNPSKLILRKSL